jgi:hypothetical protein
MPEHCDRCGLKFNLEPGFFYGAMYIGYGISIAYLSTFYLLLLLILKDFEVELYFVLAIGSLLALTPIIFRLSRSIWLAIFVKYNRNAIKKWEEETGGVKRDNPCINV